MFTKIKNNILVIIFKTIFLNYVVFNKPFI